MKTIKKLGLLTTLLIISCSLLNVLPVLANSQPEKPMVLDCYSIKRDSGYEINVSGLVKDNLEVLIYIEGTYKGLANISKKSGEINPFHFSMILEKSKKTYNISVISKDPTSSVLSAPVYTKDRRISQSPESKPSLFKGGSTQENSLSSAPNKEKSSSKKTGELPVPPAPTLIGPNKDDVIGTPKPFILGLTRSGSRVHVYIDGVYNGKTPILTDKSGTASFAYRPFLNLKPGQHQAWTIAENSEGKKGPVSKKIFFTIEERMVSPTLSTQDKNLFTKQGGLALIGWAKNNSLIKVFIDHILEAKLEVEDHESGTANFAYDSDKILSRGDHLVYATAVDEKGKESPWSNIIYFTIYEPKIATSASEQASEQATTSSSGAVIRVDDDPENASVSDSENLIKTKDVGTAKGISEENDQKTEITPGPQNQKLNIIIFILFLVAIITWMLLVNKELLKENKKEE